MPDASPRHVAHFERVLGTSMELQIVGDPEAPASAEIAALVEIDRLEAIFSVFQEDSEFVRWERSFDEAVPVSSELAHVLGEAERWREATGGAFDPVMATGGGPRWRVDGETARRLTPRKASLHSLAKGFIVDRAAETAAAVPGVESVLIEVGGDLRHVGPDAVRIEVADPLAPHENVEPLARATIRNSGVATSGTDRRGAHLIDPRTGEPATRVVSATVVADRSADADALATALFVLPPREGIALADRLGVAAFLVFPDRRSRASKGWRRISS